MKQFKYWLLPVLRMPEIDSRILRKMRIPFPNGLHTPNAQCFMPSGFPWTGDLGTAAAKDQDVFQKSAGGVQFAGF